MKEKDEENNLRIMETFSAWREAEHGSELGDHLRDPIKRSRSVLLWWHRLWNSLWGVQHCLRADSKPFRSLWSNKEWGRKHRWNRESKQQGRPKSSPVGSCADVRSVHSSGEAGLAQAEWKSVVHIPAVCNTYTLSANCFVLTTLSCSSLPHPLVHLVAPQESSLSVSQNLDVKRSYF